MKTLLRLAATALLLGLVGCGSIRETTTPRTSTEMLLISTAAERAVQSYDPKDLAGKRVFIDASRFDSVDKPYVLSALRNHLARQQVLLSDTADARDDAHPKGAEVVLQVRNATLGIWDGDFTLGIPALPISGEGFDQSFFLPPLYFVRRLSAQGFAKLQMWLFDPATKGFLGRTPDLWGHSYYNQWWFFGIGPFDGSNDVYPETDIGQWVPGTDKEQS